MSFCCYGKPAGSIIGSTKATLAWSFLQQNKYAGCLFRHRISSSPEEAHLAARRSCYLTVVPCFKASSLKMCQNLMSKQEQQYTSRWQIPLGINCSGNRFGASAKANWILVEAHVKSIVSRQVLTPTFDAEIIEVFKQICM